jgi:hypothetical protein
VVKKPPWEILWNPSDGLPPPWATGRSGPGFTYTQPVDAEPQRPAPDWPCEGCRLKRSESVRYRRVLALYHWLPHPKDMSVWEFIAVYWRLCDVCGRYHTTRHAERLAAVKGETRE